MKALLPRRAKSDRFSRLSRFAISSFRSQVCGTESVEATLVDHHSNENEAESIRNRGSSIARLDPVNQLPPDCHMASA